MQTILTTLKKKTFILSTIGLTLILWGIYTLFDLRQGGTHLNLLSTHLEPFSFFIVHFGPGYVILRLVCDGMIAFFSALTLMLTIDQYRSGNSFLKRSVCSTSGSLLFGFAVFGCPTCVLPLAGTLGVLFSSSTLPLFGFEFKIVALLLNLGMLLWVLYRFKAAAIPEMAAAGKIS